VNSKTAIKGAGKISIQGGGMLIFKGQQHFDYGSEMVLIV